MKILGKLDYFGPQIGIIHSGSMYKHTKITLIISIICILLIIASIFYFSRTIIWRKLPNTNYYEVYVENLQNFYVNYSTFAHFITMNNLELPNPIKFDFTSFRIIGINKNLNIYTKWDNYNLNVSEHWIYGPCNINKINGSNHYFNEIIKDSACISKYFNEYEKKYYDINETGFVWPQLTYGNITIDNSFYSIIIEKCEEDTLQLILGEGKKCKSELEIRNIIKNGTWVDFTVLDHYVNLLDFENPKNIYWLTTENIINNDALFINNLYFNPLTISSNHGYFLDQYEKTIYYEFDRNDLSCHHELPVNKNIYLNYNLYLNNKMNYYERRYNKVQDIISEIGGFANLINSFVVFFIGFYNQYLILENTKNLVYYLYKGKKLNEKEEKENKKEINKKMNDIEINTVQNLKVNTDINNSFKLNNLNEIKKDNDINLNLEKTQNVKEDGDNNIDELFEKSTDFHFCSYLIHLITFETKYPKYKIYSDFRERILKDEQIIENGITINNIIRGHKQYRQIYNIKEILKKY